MLEAKVYTFDEMLQEKGYLIYTNVGVSMMPFLRERRDIIEIRQKDRATRCRRYDVVMYKMGNKYILHRILKVRQNDYVICGDHNFRREFGVTDDRILGVMTRVIRNGKSIATDNIWYKLYVHLWCDLYPIRAFILYFKQMSAVLFRRIKKGRSDN